MAALIQQLKTSCMPSEMLIFLRRLLCVQFTGHSHRSQR